MTNSTMKLGQSGGVSGYVNVYDIRTSLTSLSIMTEGHLPENAIVGSASLNSMYASDMTNKNGLPIITAYIPDNFVSQTTKYATITESGCNSANTYTCTAITYPNGTSVNLNVASTLSLQATVTDGVAKLNVTFIDLSTAAKK